MQRPQTILVLLALGFVACLATQPTYYPYGPQTNVPETDLLGWRRCWSNSYVDTPYDYTANITSIFTECSGDYLLYGCRSDGSTNLALLAAGQRSAVLNNTGLTSEDVTNDNGVAWYSTQIRLLDLQKKEIKSIRTIAIILTEHSLN